METLTVELPWAKGSEVHLGLQGSWKVRRPLRGAKYESRLHGTPSLPGFCYESGGGWDVGLIQANPSGFQIEADYEMCRLTFEQAGADPLTITRGRLASWDDVVEWFREILRIPVQPEKPIRKFARLFCPDIHDSSGNLLHTFKDVIDFIQLVHQHGLAADSLFYLPGWDGKYDATYPDYTASSIAGGWKDFTKMHVTAQQLGAEIFLHLNHWGLSQDKMKFYPQLKSELVLGSDRAPKSWPGATWCGATNSLYYVKTDSDAWIELMSERLKHLRSHGARGFFLDQIGAAPDSESIAKLRRFCERALIQDAECFYGLEAPVPELVGQFPLAQLWGPAWCGLPEDRNLLPSRLLADVYANVTQFVGHLGTPAPYPCRYSWTNYVYLVEHGAQSAFDTMWAHHQRVGVLPTIRIDTSRTEANQHILIQKSLKL